MPSLLSQLDQQSSQIRFDVIDFSAGELIRLHEGHEIVIQPEFQRMFRWSRAQQSRLIESMLLGLPVPQIVLFQRQDGILELIDGLQRVGSLITFMTGRSLTVEQEAEGVPLRLTGCDILSSLNDQDFESLDAVVQLELKRKTLRAIVIKRTNDPSLRYEMFKRLNSGGSPAEPHEIRNASLRIVGRRGEEFLNFLHECSQHRGFQEVTSVLSDQAKERLGLEELVLRFFALKLFLDRYKGNISDWLDRFSEAVVNGEIEFDYASERAAFEKLFDLLADKFGDEAFVKHKDGRPLGGLAPAYFDAVTMGLLPLTSRLALVQAAKAKHVLNEAVGHANTEFRLNVGPGANAAPRLRKRIEVVKATFERAFSAPARSNNGTARKRSQ